MFKNYKLLLFLGSAIIFLYFSVGKYEEFSLKKSVSACVLAKSKIKKDMRFIGEELGFLFQIADDLLDIRGSKKNVGKPVKKDKKKGKSTLIKLLGYKKTLEFALRRKKMIIGKLKKYGNKSKKLIEITNFILDRSY